MRQAKAKIASLGILFALLSIGFQIQAPAQWQKPAQPPAAGGPLTCLVPHPLDPAKFLTASKHSVFENSLEKTWRPIWSQGDSSSAIRRLYVFPVLSSVIFAITDRAVFMGDLKNGFWRQVYQANDRDPLSFTVHPGNPNRWFLGTRKGLWESNDAGKTWSPSAAFRKSSPVSLLIFDRERLFLANERTLYLILPGNSTRPVLDLSGPEPEIPVDDALDADTTEEPADGNARIYDLISSKREPQEWFLATSRGPFRSGDGGYCWDPMPRSGLQSPAIHQLAYSEKTGVLYAATPRGIYAYDARMRTWTELFRGLAKHRAQGLAVLNEDRLIAITEEGFVQYPLQPGTPEATPSLAIYRPPAATLSLLRELLKREPSAREVHKHVIRYANVGNGKIKRWHAASRLAGLLPSFSFGKNLDRNASITTYSGKYITGPEDVSKGWDADVSWDFGDAIYSSNQTSIDSREKLMVELRNDLLSEVTRIFYERRRLQISLVFTPPASEQEHLESLLRMDELTALLDSMTDGFFSKQIERVYREKPELDKLWGCKPPDNG
jgi:hypothetical protein